MSLFLIVGILFIAVNSVTLFFNAGDENVLGATCSALGLACGIFLVFTN